MSAHLLPCPDCNGAGCLQTSMDPNGSEWDCERCNSRGQVKCDGDCDRDECAESLPYVLPEVMACL